MNTKPTKLEPGMRFKGTTTGDVYVTLDWAGNVRRESDGVTMMAYLLLLDSAYTYLGGPPPSPVSGGMMEADAKGNPVACLFCALAKPMSYSGYACEPCIVRESISSLSDTKMAWDAGARDFPRLPQPSQGAPTKPQCSIDGENWIDCQCGGAFHPESRLAVVLTRKAAAAPEAPIYGRMVGEMRSQDGGPLSALEKIKARRQPEPWVPTVDDWDLLPDAGT